MQVYFTCCLFVLILVCVVLTLFSLFSYQSEILEKSLHVSEVSGSVSDMALHGGRGSVTVVPSASLIEHLQSLLKQKEGELSNSQVPYYSC